MVLIRWESQVNSIKALRFQLLNIIEALEEVSEIANDSIAKSEAKCLASEISIYEFILNVVIWYDILVQVNIVTKRLQGKNADINISNDMQHSIIVFLKSYRDSGFENTKLVVDNLVEEIRVDSVLKKIYQEKKEEF